MWKPQYDSSLQQVYYLNTDDGLVSFDLPCEVNSPHNKSKCPRNMLSKITSRLSLHRSKSPHEPVEMPSARPASVSSLPDLEPSRADKPRRTENSDYSKFLEYTRLLDHASSYVLERPLYLFDLENASVSSDESIQLFYLDLEPTDIYYDNEASVYYDEQAKAQNVAFDKEQERLELRLQILKELY